jgi:hypothetical protein
VLQVDEHVKLLPKSRESPQAGQSLTTDLLGLEVLASRIVPRRLLDLSRSPLIPLEQSAIIEPLSTIAIVNHLPRSTTVQKTLTKNNRMLYTREAHSQNPLRVRYLLFFAACSSARRIFARALFEPPSFGPFGASFAPLTGAGAALRCCCRASSTDS